MRASSRLRTYYVIAALALGVALVTISLFAIGTVYQRLKADNINGYGNFTVRECTHVGPWDYNYQCNGEWRQGSGMLAQQNASVSVVGRYKKGELIQDVYPSDSLYVSGSGELTTQFVTGATRRSLLYNLPQVLLTALTLGYIVSILIIFSHHAKRRRDHSI